MGFSTDNAGRAEGWHPKISPDVYKRQMKNPGAIKGLSSGFRRLNLTLDGLQPGAMIVIAARPGGAAVAHGDIFLMKKNAK